MDAENLAGSASFTHAEAEAVRRGYWLAARPVNNDQVVLATSHHAANFTWFAWPATVRRLLRSGEDGADRALLEVIAGENVADRFWGVTIGSGDGTFALAAADLQRNGCHVTVVTRRRSLSRALRLAVHDVRFIDPPLVVAREIRPAEAAA